MIPWWLVLILILVVFAVGIIFGIKMTTEVAVEMMCEEAARHDPIEPIFVMSKGQYYCGRCKHPIGVSGVNYCESCGNEIAWWMIGTNLEADI